MKKNNFIKLAAALSLLALLCTAAAPSIKAEPNGIELLSINVGKADAHLLISGESYYLIDTGTAESWGAISAALRVRGVHELSGVILTHTHKDHTGGAMALATSGIEIKAWYASGYYAAKKKEHPAVKAAAVRHQEVIWLRGGDTLPLDGGTMRVIGPVEYSEKENNNSLVIRVETPDGSSVLLCGDMEFPEEQSLIRQNLIGPCTVLKVGNHANPDACSNELIALTRPRIAVIPTDTAAEPDTPDARILKALYSVGAVVCVTQDAPSAILVKIQNGEASAEIVRDTYPDTVPGMEIMDKSVAQDMVVVRNNGEGPVDLSGWYLYSTRGGETFVFPDGTVLEEDGRLMVSSLSSEDSGDFVWPEENVWHKKKEDITQLYDPYGRLMDEWE